MSDACEEGAHPGVSAKIEYNPMSSSARSNWIEASSTVPRHLWGHHTNRHPVPTGVGPGPSALPASWRTKSWSSVRP